MNIYEVYLEEASNRHSGAIYIVAWDIDECIDFTHRYIFHKYKSTSTIKRITVVGEAVGRIDVSDRMVVFPE